MTGALGIPDLGRSWKGQPIPMTDTIAERGQVIVTSDGRPFFLLDPMPDDIHIEHIAHATSNLCRWTGHVKQFYSVAQHCVDVSLLVEPEFALTALLHDASEAYIGDISTPLKRVMEQQAPRVIKDIENNIHRAIAFKFGSLYPHPPEVQHADLQAAAAERRDYLVGWDQHGVEWGPHWPEPSPARLHAWSPLMARLMYLKRFEELTA